MSYAGGMPGTIVVGIDGSPASKAGLRWAAEEAAIRAARLVVIHAWSFVPPAPMAEPGLVPVPAIDYAATIEAERSAVLGELDAVFAEVFPDGAPSGVERKLVEGDAGDALEDASRDADLVVVKAPDDE